MNPKTFRSPLIINEITDSYEIMSNGIVSPFFDLNYKPNVLSHFPVESFNAQAQIKEDNI